jgi:hypothetical protein
VARVGDYSWPPPSDCEGFLCLPRRSAKGNSSGLRVFELPHLWVGSCGVQVGLGLCNTS